jgi:hypothetical protein
MGFGLTPTSCGQIFSISAGSVMSKRKTICDHSKLLVAPLFRLETEIQETMLLYEQMNSFYYVDL